jgi:hypothetical protein
MSNANPYRALNVLMKVKICTVHLPPEMLERVSTLKYQRFVETKSSSFPSVQVQQELSDSRTFDSPLESDGSPLRLCETSQCSTAQKDGQCTDEAAGEDGNTCLVCWERASDAILLECGHSGICIVCAQKLWHEGRRCLLCREGFAAIMHIVDGHTATVRTRARPLRGPLASLQDEAGRWHCMLAQHGGAYASSFGLRGDAGERGGARRHA